MPCVKPNYLHMNFMATNFTKTVLSLVAIAMLWVGTAVAQNSISGSVLEEGSDAPLVGASVILQGTTMGALTDVDGDFNLSNVANGEYTVVISYYGFVAYEAEVAVNGNVDLGTITMTPSGVGLDEVEILASIVTDRKTPVAVSTIDGDVVAQLVGNQEFPEILRSTPSIYATKQGGGFGDSRINIRGFDQRNTAVMINGIPVNDMENGWVYWSNWAGLSDVTSTIQVQRGLGASKLAVPSVGGSINIVTNPADFKKGGAATFSLGNDGYQKYAAVASTGLTANGFAATVQLTHTRGNGYVQGTEFQAYSYFLSMSKNFGTKHTLALTALGAPQWHHQRLYNRFDAITLSTYDNEDIGGIRFNPLAGTLNGEAFSFRRNFYHKPKVFLNHYWNISDRTSLKTSAYVSFGLGGGTGPRGRIQNDSAFWFDSFSGFGQRLHDENGHFRYDDLVAYHQGTGQLGGDTKDPNGDGTYTTTSSGDGIIRRGSMNYHTWYGILSTLDYKLTDNLNLVAGIDARYYKGEHFRRVENLMGLDGYVSRANTNNPSNLITEVAPANFGSFYSNSYKESNNVLNYHNDGLVSWLGLFTQLEYTSDRLTAFASFSGSNQGFKRIDYFVYESDDPDRISDWENFLGGTAKAGVSYAINNKMNVFVNGGYFSRQPIFDNVFLNFRNDVNVDVKNQTVQAFEAGYNYTSGNFSASLNLYHTLWGNRQFDEGVTVRINDSTQVDGLAIFENVAQLHQGVELELSYRPIPQLSIDAMLSVGNWRYTDNFTTTITDTDNNQSLGEATIFAQDLKVGDAAQTTANIRATYEVVNGVRIYAQYYYADNLYARFNVNDNQFFTENAQVVKLPSYGLVDAGAFARIPVGKLYLEWGFNMNNILNTKYISELYTNNLEGISTNDMGEMTDAELETFKGQNFGFYGFGRTWNTSLKIRF